MEKKSKKRLLLSAIFIIILIALDQITKHLAVIYLKDKSAIPLIKDIFELQYLENTSAAFGIDPISILHNIFHFEVFETNPELFLMIKMGFFIILTLIIVFLFWFILSKIPNNKRFVFLDFILMFFIAGALGNFIDRVSQQYVVDFLYFKLINFPIFNVADIYVTCAAFLLIFLGLFYYKDDDYNMIFPSKKRNKED